MNIRLDRDYFTIVLRPEHKETGQVWSIAFDIEWVRNLIFDINNHFTDLFYDHYNADKDLKKIVDVLNDRQKDYNPSQMKYTFRVAKVHISEIVSSKPCRIDDDGIWHTY